jgi:hypothetical protein
MPAEQLSAVGAGFTCPPWCTSHTESERASTRSKFNDVHHFEYGAVLTAKRYGGPGFLEVLADLACPSDDRGLPTAPFVYLHTEGHAEAELRTVEQVDAVIRDLTECVDNLRRWRDQVGTSAATCSDAARSVA